MRAGPWLLVVVLGCTSTPPNKTWAVYMDSVVGPAYDDVLEPATRAEGATDLGAVARAAREAADVMALGHGPLVDPRVPDFAERARAAEQLLREIAAAADGGRREELPAMITRLNRRHCLGCHEAAGITGPRPTPIQ